MSSDRMPIWLRYSERAFAFNFVAFSFVMFSCWFPTGFSATFSTFAFFFALPIFLYRIRHLDLNPYEIVGLVLFGWLSLSVIWSKVPVLDSLGYLSEYRIYFMLPIFISALALNETTQRVACGAAIIGALIALVSSYGLSFEWWRIDGATLSLANRIYHGFIMSTVFLVCLLVARESVGVIRLVSTVVSLLVVYNVLNIETGRTGYAQVFCVVFLFAVLSFSRIKAGLFILMVVILAGVAYSSLDRFSSRIDETITGIEDAVFNDRYDSSVGYRLTFYRGAISIGLDNPLTGVGVGGAERTLKLKAENKEIAMLTDNVHSEFMNMFVVGGIPGLTLYVAFVGSILFSGLAVRPRSRALGDAVIGVGVILFISGMFNSTIKDYGEKHALIIILSILGAQLLGNRRLR